MDQNPDQFLGPRDSFASQMQFGWDTFKLSMYLWQTYSGSMLTFKSNKTNYDLEVGISVGKMGKFCYDTYLISRHIEAYFELISHES